MPPEAIVRIIGRARRRLVAMNVARGVVAIVAVLAAAGAIVFAIARFVVLPWAEPTAAIVAVLAVAVIASVALIRRPSSLQAAIELDQRLGGRDQVSTALELSHRGDLTDIERRQIARSSAWAEGRSLADFGSIWPSRRLIGLAAVALAAALVLAIPASSADARQAADEEIAAIVDAVADELERLADELVAPEVADELRQTAEELRDSNSLDEAVEQLGDARQRLAEKVDPEALPLKTALSGLDEKLRQEPIAGGEDTQSQIEQLKAELGDLSAAEQAAAAARLEELASQVAGSAPDLADALSQAAAAIESGDGVAALDDVLAAMDAATNRVGAAGDLSDARAAVRRVQGELGDARDARAGDSSRSGAGDGSGDGSGGGDGTGSGGGSTGAGSGTGTGGGGGGSGTGADNPNPVGGGTGTFGDPIPGAGDNDVPRDPTRSTVFDPLVFDQGEENRVDFNTSDPTGEVQGRTRGDGIQNEAILPYTDRYSVYQQQALDALDRMLIPGSLQDIVRNYFTELAR